MTATATRTSAATLIADHMASCLPPGTPACYHSMANARFAGSGRKRVATAVLEMFDGQFATVEVFQWELGFGHRWTVMAGGDTFYEDGRWQRQSEAA